jgi:phosphatidylinositol alpha-1,6-mannosyltransferase
MALLILTDNYPPQPGGIGTYAYELARNLHKEGLELIVLAPNSEGGKALDSKERFITYRLLAKRPIFELHALVLLVYLVLLGYVDRVCGMTWHPCGSVAMLVSLLFGLPFHVIAHGGELLESNEKPSGRLKYKLLLNPLRRLVLARATAIFANSAYTARLLVSQGVAEGKITVVPPGVDEERLQGCKNKAEVVQKYGLKGKRVLLTVARLESHKGQDTVIGLMPELLSQIPNLVYVIVGTGSQEATLKDMARHLNLNGGVVFSGLVTQEELLGFYGVCDVFVMVSKKLPDKFEGFGIAFLEANACGKPVIGGKSGGIPEAVIHEETGLLVDPDNHQEIAEAVRRLLTDNLFARRLGETGRRRVQEGFNWRTTARKVKDTIYAQ